MASQPSVTHVSKMLFYSDSKRLDFCLFLFVLFSSLKLHQVGFEDSETLSKKTQPYKAAALKSHHSISILVQPELF